MTTIAYLCYKCRKKFDIVGTYARNEVGRKSCNLCHSNKDNLVVISLQEFNRVVKEKPTEDENRG